MWMHQLLLADILKFTVSVLEKNFQKLFKHKFYNTFYLEHSH